jgi:hypothetical protein
MWWECFIPASVVEMHPFPKGVKPLLQNGACAVAGCVQ